jgi:hypothetical protein
VRESVALVPIVRLESLVRNATAMAPNAPNAEPAIELAARKRIHMIGVGRDVPRTILVVRDRPRAGAEGAGGVFPRRIASSHGRPAG